MEKKAKMCLDLNAKKPLDLRMKHTAIMKLYVEKILIHPLELRGLVSVNYAKQLFLRRNTYKFILLRNAIKLQSLVKMILTKQ
jgi:hypothetical protein